MPERPRLEIVDDPVARAEAPAPAQPRSPADKEATPQTDVEEATSTATPSSESPRAPAPRRYRDEDKRAVFGRVPRSLSRRLERAVVELREEMEDLTQEQVLAALLHQHVEPAEPDRLNELAETVRAYRARL
jgi:hypothetical protein